MILSTDAKTVPVVGKRWMEVAMKWVGWFSAACVGMVFAVLLLIWASGGFAGPGLTGNGLAAMLLGVVISTGLGVGLMALVFYSNRSRQDEAVHNVGLTTKPR